MHPCVPCGLSFLPTLDQSFPNGCRMKKPEDPRLTRLSKICLALPETTRSYNGQHASFLIRKKTFAYFLNDHHGDGIVALTCKVLPGRQRSPCQSAAPQVLSARLSRIKGMGGTPPGCRSYRLG